MALQASHACCEGKTGSHAELDVRQEHYLGFPLVSDQQVVGGEVAVHHIVAVHELHSGSSLTSQLEPQRPGAIQAEAG